MRSAQIRKYSFKMLEELVNSLEKENITKKNLFLSTYTNFLNGMDFRFVQIEEKLFRVWKKYIIFHLIVIITSIGYLFFGAYSDNNILVHRQIVSISLLILLLPFIFSIVSAFKAIKPDVEIARNYAIRIQEISKAYRVGKMKGVLDLILKYANEDSDKIK